MPSAAQIAANQKNSQLSTGPTSEAGKAKSSLNAVKSGLTGQTVVLPTEDAALYQSHVAQFIEHYTPVGDEEGRLVQSLADTEWRLLRIPSLEFGIYAIGRRECADLFPNEDEAVRKHLIEAQVFLTYQRQLNNLSIQENRLRRQRDKDTARLRDLQENRKQQTKASLDSQQHSQQAFDPAKIGFEFSVDKIQLHSQAVAANSGAKSQKLIANS